VREFAAPRHPFVPSRAQRWRPARDGEERRSFVELPMTVASPLRLPWLGTSLALARDPVGRLLTRGALAHDGPCVLELHAIDFMGDEDGAARELVGAQPDLRVGLDDKLRRLERAMGSVARAREVVPLAEIAERA
jgi:hypothetical protein